MAEDRRLATIRLAILTYAVIGIFTTLAVGFWVMQVVEHAKFEEMAENNHQRTLALRAPRGIVFDRDKKVLVLNRRSYSISIDREHTKDLNRTIRLLANELVPHLTTELANRRHELHGALARVPRRYGHSDAILYALARVLPE